MSIAFELKKQNRLIYLILLEHFLQTPHPSIPPLYNCWNTIKFVVPWIVIWNEVEKSAQSLDFETEINYVFLYKFIGYNRSEKMVRERERKGEREKERV